MKIKVILSVCIVSLLFSSSPLTAQKTSSRSQNKLTFLIVGGRDGFIKRFGDVIPYRRLFYSFDKKNKAEKMLLSVACQPLSKAEVMMKSGLSEDEFEDISSLLLSLNMISSKNNTWATTLPVLTSQEMASLRQKLSPLADKMAKTTSRLIPQIKNLYDQNRLPSDPEWKDTVHLFISYFLLDTHLLQSLSTMEEKMGFKKFYSEKQKIIPAFFLETGENFTNFGCNSYSFKGNENSKSIFVFVLHGTLFERIQISLNKYERNPDFSAALSKLISQDEKSSLTDKEVKILEDLGWVENDKLMVPMIDSQIRATLIPPLAKAAESTAEVTFKNFDIILNAFIDSPYSKFLDGVGDYIQYCYHMLMYLTLEKLIQQGVLPPIPKPLPKFYGTYVLYSSNTISDDGKTRIPFPNSLE